MQKYFFSFKEFIDGEAQPVHIEIVVSAPSRKQARPIAMRKMRQIQRSVERCSREACQPVSTFVFAGVN